MTAPNSEPGFNLEAARGRLESVADDAVRIGNEIQRLYREDDLPWVVGYSGGKDSTATLQLIWLAICTLPEEERKKKPIHVISTDTLVENPVVSSWVDHSLKAMAPAAEGQGIDIRPHRLIPKLEDRFWVNLIGRGYPAPRPKFRWCTSRLKINASNQFIRDVADEYGEAILALGSRKRESDARRRVLEEYEGSTRQLLSRNSDSRLDRVWVYTPITQWSNDDVWEYLVTVENPWGHSNNALFNMYRGATADAECPLVVDTSTPSCGDSRFGCFVCTLVDKDKSMQAMIQNDEEKRWMQPLAELRNKYLDISEDRPKREFRRMDGSLTLFVNSHGEPSLVHGPYKQDFREELLTAVLQAQRAVRASAKEMRREDLAEFELIGLDELEAIREIWVRGKHEIEDSLPRIFEAVMGETYPNQGADDNQLFGPEDVTLLRELAAGPDDPDEIHFQVLRELLHIEQGYRTASRRVGIYDALDDALRRGAFTNEDEALRFALARRRNGAPVGLDTQTPSVGLTSEADLGGDSGELLA